MSATSALRKLLSGIMLAAGLLIAVSCGLCTGYFAFVSLSSRGGGGIGPFLGIGFIATAIGATIAWGGTILLRD